MNHLDLIVDIGTTLASVSGHFPGYEFERPVSPTLMNQREACIQKISDLSATLMKDLNRMNACKLACAFLFTPSDENTADFVFRTVDYSLFQKDSIGRIFQGAESFLEILHEYEKHLQVITPKNELFEPANNPKSPPNDPATPQERMEIRWSVFQTYLGRPKPPGVMTPNSTTETYEKSTIPHISAIDMPSMLTIINCYICLLKIFETVFLAFQYIMQVPPSLPLYTKLPPTVPDLHINGFQLKNYRGLQLKIMMQVTRHMLNSVEKAIGLMNEEPGSGGICGDPVFKHLLQPLLKRNGLDTSGEGKSTGVEKVRDLLTEMEVVLDSQ
jgi:hypothetical protein